MIEEALARCGAIPEDELEAHIEALTIIERGAMTGDRTGEMHPEEEEG